MGEIKINGIRVFILVGMLVLLCGIVSADIYFSCEMGPFVKHSDHGYYTVFLYDNPYLSGSPVMSEEVHFYNTKTWYAYNKAKCASGNGFEIGDYFYSNYICTEEIFDDRCAEINLDMDSDGYNWDVDCDDNDFNINPGAEDAICDGVDNDCDGDIDEGYFEAVTSCGVGICSAGGLMQCIFGVEVSSCVEGNPEIEVCDGLDNDCNGVVDEGCSGCIENIVNSSWSEWTNVSSCVNGIMEQLRTLVEHDNNFCGTFDNVTYEETEEINCSLPVCSVDANCSSDYYEDRYCDGDDIYETFHSFSCVNESCVENVSEELVKECSEDCDDGKCVYDDDDDDDDDGGISWNRNPTVWNDLYEGDDTVEIVRLDAVENKEESLWWLWISLLIIFILLLIWAIVMILRY